MKNNTKTLQIALGGIVAAGLMAGPASAMKPKWDGHEKCYGVAKKGMNDCGNARHKCGGMSAADHEGDEWLYLPSGTCEKLAGGSLEEKK
jgi:uncharacterized membrane protein